MALQLQQLKLDIGKFKKKAGLGKNKEVLILVILVFIFILMVYFYVFLRPAVTRLAVLLPQISHLSAELRNAKSDIANRDRLEETKISLQSKIDFYEKKLPGQKEIPKLLEDLSSKAIQAGVKIVAIRPIESPGEKTQTAEFYQETPIGIDARCGYHQLGRFAQELETADRFMKISDISIKAGSTDVTKHDVKLIIITYTLTDESDVKPRK